MKIITQISMFDDTQNENLGDLERLQKVFDNLPDEKLIRRLKEKRGKGRNEWSVEAMWNSFIASFIFDHDSIASLLRELNRNSQLRIICGFQPHIYSVLTDKKDEYGKRISEIRYKLAPTASAYTNFLNNLKECEQELREMFDTLVKYMYENLNGFGEIMAADGKAIQSYAGRISKKNSGNKGERDADWCRKEYTITKPNSEKVVKTKKWRRLYKKRTSIERINGRIDRDFKFEKHTIRGLRKMKMFLTVTFIIQLALAKSKIDSGITKGLARHIA